VAKTSAAELRVFINGERIGGESISIDVKRHGLIVDGEDLGWLASDIEVREIEGHIEAHITMPTFAAMLPISAHRYCEHSVTEPSGMAAKAGGVLVELRQCQECGRILRRPYGQGG
jgi:hypothetical protein